MIIEEDDEVSKGRSKAVKQAALERDGHRCRMCFTGIFLTAHHVIPLSHKDGKDELSNVVILCRNCHDNIEVLYKHHIVFPSTCIAYIDYEAALYRSKHDV